MSNVAQAALLMNQKSTGVALLLTFFFGPLGLFYSSVMGGVIMLLVGGIIIVFTAGIGSILVWPICMIWAVMATGSHNKRLLLGLTQ
jgi:TM2 domain-containing membrane protein YozV